jgi:hypothetical protein
MRSIRRPTVVGGLALAAALTVPPALTTASPADAAAPEQVIFQTTDEDNIPHMGFTVCAELHGPDQYKIDLYLLTPDHRPTTGPNCGTIRFLDLPGAQDMLDSVDLDPDGTHDTARAEDDYDSHEVRNACNIYQVFPGTNILAGNVLNDAVDAPIDVIVQVITLLTTADTVGAKPIHNGSCL